MKKSQPRPEHTPRSLAEAQSCAGAYTRAPCAPRSREREKIHAAGRAKLANVQKLCILYVPGIFVHANVSVVLPLFTGARIVVLYSVVHTFSGCPLRLSMSIDSDRFGSDLVISNPYDPAWSGTRKPNILRFGLVEPNSTAPNRRKPLRFFRSYSNLVRRSCHVSGTRFFRRYYHGSVRFGIADMFLRLGSVLFLLYLVGKNPMYWFGSVRFGQTEPNRSEES